MLPLLPTAHKHTLSESASIFFSHFVVLQTKPISDLSFHLTGFRSFTILMCNGVAAVFVILLIVLIKPLCSM